MSGSGFVANVSSRAAVWSLTSCTARTTRTRRLANSDGLVCSIRAAGVSSEPLISETSASGAMARPPHDRRDRPVGQQCLRADDKGHRRRRRDRRGHRPKDGMPHRPSWPPLRCLWAGGHDADAVVGADNGDRAVSIGPQHPHPRPGEQVDGIHSRVAIGVADSRADQRDSCSGRSVAAAADVLSRGVGP